jgi:concanavalin A-like lectin/glucanase superfamily protein/fibronectin type III domain protein
MRRGLWVGVTLLAVPIFPATAAAESGSLTIAWDPNAEADVAGYRVHIGTQPGRYSVVTDAGDRTMLTIPALVEGQQYFFTVTAYSAAGVPSEPSGEISAVVPTLVPSDGLVAAYGFEETSGSVVGDASPNRLAGSISGAVRTASGRYGRAMLFDGIDDWITVADAPALDLSTMTIEAWVKPAALSGWRSVLLKEDLGTLSYALYAHDGAPHPAATIRVGSDVSAVGTSVLPLGAWTHVAATFDGTQLQFFVNGALVDTRPAAGALEPTDGALRIGGNAVWGEYFDGVIDEVRIYNRALAPADIVRDMNAAVETGLIAAYGFEEATGATIVDSSGSGYTGTLAGPARTRNGRFGQALSFDGINDMVTVGPELHASRVTVEAWVYPTALSGWRSVVMKEAANGLVFGLYAHDNLPHPAMTVGVKGVDYSAGGTAALALNTWSHLAATYDGTTVRLYVNGVEAGTAAGAGALPASANPLRIGGNSVWGEYFKGRIDEVRIYDRALSAAEITADMNRAVMP